MFYLLTYLLTYLVTYLHKQQQSEPESEDSSGDRDGDDELTGAKEVDDDGFVKPMSHKRRQRRVKRAVGSMEQKNTISDSESASKRLRSHPESSATASASTIMDPTAGRQYNRTRVPPGRRASCSAATYSDRLNAVNLVTMLHSYFCLLDVVIVIVVDRL